MRKRFLRRRGRILRIPHGDWKPGSKKVALKPGHSQIHWMMKVQSSDDGVLAGRAGQRPRRSIPMSEVAQHATTDDAWTVLRGRVYNITAYLDYHPGGVPIIMSGAGRDMTELFMKHHSWVNFESMIGALYIGDLAPELSTCAEECDGVSKEDPGNTEEDEERHEPNASRGTSRNSAASESQGSRHLEGSSGGSGTGDGVDEKDPGASAIRANTVELGDASISCAEHNPNDKHASLIIDVPNEIGVNLQEMLDQEANARDHNGRISVVLDLGYPWPKELRPAKERKGAVVKQLENFVTVLKDQEQRGFGTMHLIPPPPSPKPQLVPPEEVEVTTDKENSSMLYKCQKVRFPAVCCSGCGAADIAGKLSTLSPWVTVESEREFFQADVDKSQERSKKRVVLYLSPDAGSVLNTTQGFPMSGCDEHVTFVVGGLVDRKVKRGRSKARAEAVHELLAKKSYAEGSEVKEANEMKNEADYGERDVKTTTPTSRLCNKIGQPASVSATAPSRPICEEDVKVLAVQLPLGEDCGAPLNIDTVLTMLLYWQRLSEEKGMEDLAEPAAAEGSMASPPRSSDPNNHPGGALCRWAIPVPLSGGAQGISVGHAFAEARRRALAEHAIRHPNQGKHVL